VPVESDLSPATAFRRTIRAPAHNYKVITPAGNYLRGEAVEASCLPKLQYIFTTRSYFYHDPMQNLQPFDGLANGATIVSTYYELPCGQIHLLRGSFYE
jgi:hypothetical protein